MNYRHDIDGLRAIAVISVFIFHLNIGFLTGGYLGVDIFFVISGFLITSIIFEEIKKNEFSIYRFYERRIRRIIPALYFTLFLTIIASIYFLTPLQYVNVSKTLISSVFFLSNIYFHINSRNYFGQELEQNPLLHTWSLSVEEQYYLFYPLLLLIIWKFKKNYFTIILSLIFIFSLLFAEKYGLFYFTVNRIWEISLGALAYLSNFKIKENINSFLSFTGFIFIILSFFIFKKGLNPGFNTIVPCLGIFLILKFNRPNFLIYKLLRLKPLAFLGLLSYSFYLFHHPIIVFIKLRFYEINNINLFILSFLITFCLSFLSYNYVEKVFRKKNYINKKKIFLYYMLSTIVLISIASFIIFNKGLEKRYTIDQLKVLEFEKYNFEKYYNMHGCFFKSNELFEDKISNKCINNSKLLLLGDSLAAALSFGLRKKFSVDSITSAGCPSVKGFIPIDNKECNPLNTYVLENIVKNYNEIILHADWSYYYTKDNFKQKLENHLNYLNSLDKKIYIIGNVPSYNINIPKILSKNILFNLNESHYLENKNFLSQYKNDTNIKKILKKNNLQNIKFVSLLEILCKKKQNIHLCKITENENSSELFYWDKIHFTHHGSIYVADKLVFNND